MDLRTCPNAWKILSSIDRDELIAANVHLTAGEWWSFRDDPSGYLAWCDDLTAEAIWSVVESRAAQVKAA